MESNYKKEHFQDIINWKKLPVRFGKWVRSGQFIRARWFLDQRKKKKMRNIEHLAQLNQVRSMAQQQQMMNNQDVPRLFGYCASLGGLGIFGL